MSKKPDTTTHFGYQEVPLADKAGKVAEVFHSVAGKYDIMNDLMSLGVHRWWKKFTIDMAAVRPGQQVLDVASGTGDLALAFAGRIGPRGKIILSDINDSMLSRARERLVDAGMVGNVDYVLADAENLPFEDNQFDCVTIAFGLRNVTTKENALASMYRVLKPGGKLLVLEFSKPMLPGLKPIYDWYSFTMLPWLGSLVTSDSDSYQYLAESIRMHPDQETLKSMMTDAGFENCDYHNLSGGIVAVHRGYKF